MKTAQKGFTLIELMIVVAIIGILAAIAIPAYQDYTKRARVSEALTLMDGTKVAVAEYFSNYGHWPTTNASAGLSSAASITGNSVSSVNIGIDSGNATLTATMSRTTFDPTTSYQIAMLGSASANGGGSFVWSCKVIGGSTALDTAAVSFNGALAAPIPPKWLPAECR